MTVEYGILAFFMGIGAILIGALITWYVINYNKKKDEQSWWITG